MSLYHPLKLDPGTCITISLTNSTPLQIASRFGFSKYITSAIHIDICYIYALYVSKKAKTTYDLEWWQRD